VIRFGIPRAFRLALRRRDRWEREVEDEIKLHLSLRAEQLAARGASPDEAYREAVRRFGPLEESRARLVDAATRREQHMRRTEYVSDLRHDIAFAFRTLGRQKGWTAITVATLALGIGATTAVFSVVSSLLIHATPYPDPDRVVIVEQQASKGNNTGIHVSILPPTPIVNAWRTQSHSFDALEPYAFGNGSLGTEPQVAKVITTSILPSFATFAQRNPILGRMFTTEETTGHAKVALLSESVWQSRFGGTHDAVGRTIVVNDSTYTVIGVMPGDLAVPSRGRVPTDIWLPLDTANHNVGMRAVARLRRGVTIAAAQRELDTIAVRANVYPAGQLPFVAEIERPAELVGFHDSLLLLMGTVALVLLVACANVAHLMLTRAATRTREFAVRAALGAGRMRIFRQLVVESLVLAFGGAAVGLGVGWLGLKAMVALRPAGLTELDAASLDTTTLLLTAAVAVVSGVAFGVAGAFQSSRRSTQDALKTGALSTSHSRRSDRVRSLLVVTEMALSATLIVGATLLVRSVRNMQHTDLGFEPRGLYAVDINLPAKRYSTPAANAAFVQALVSRIQTMPGVHSVALSAVSPGSRSFSVGAFEIEGEPSPSAAQGTSFTDGNGIDNSYFATMGIPLTEGTLFTDTTAAANQVIVNAGFAHKHWPQGTAVGHRVRVSYQGKGDWQTIVGVARDASTNGPGAESTAPLLYGPIGGSVGGGSIMIRAEPGTDLSTPVHAVVRSLDPLLTPPTVRSVETIVAASIAGPRFTMLLLSVFTMLALLLAAIGLYGVMAYSVIQRTREIGIRVALGAQRPAIARIVMLRGLALTLGGAALGLVGAYWATRLLSKLLYGVTTLDAASFSVGAAVLVVVAVAACLVPTRRALAVDPILAIRAD
jgi:putative ABC transport system permease protein